MGFKQNIVFFMLFASVLILIRVLVVVLAVSAKNDGTIAAKDLEPNFFNLKGAIASNGIGCAEIGR